ncbi:MAG TPA: hypothetical protein VHP36_01205 [Chitinispirillaceae bacterium]|nr:hypothetical protein [Chitinispirillaceae bacterium]
MSALEICDILKQIKELYFSIKQMSVSYVDNFSEQTLEQFLKKRECLFNEISRKETEYTHLKKTDVAGTTECYQLKSEIGDLIRVIISLDSSITDKIALSMRNIRNEISNLYGTSKAALAYSNHRRS